MRRFISPVNYVLFLLPFAAWGSEGAKKKALWEFGIASFGVYAPLYPASQDSQTNGLLAPYGVYRGEFLQLGEDGFIKGIFVNTDRYELDISVRGSFNANSEESGVREGMPDLDFLGEIGPQFTYHLTDDENYDIDVDIPVRAVFSSDFSNLRHQGYVFNPAIAFSKNSVATNLDLSARVGLSFATDKLHAYFYEVDEAFQTPSRMAYYAKSGYLGADFTLGLNYALSRSVNLFAGGQISSFHGAANRSSPLFEEKLTYSFGVGLVWKLYESDERAAD